MHLQKLTRISSSRSHMREYHTPLDPLPFLALCTISIPGYARSRSPMLATSPVLPRPSIPFTSVHAHHVKHESSVHIRRPSSALCMIHAPSPHHCRTLYLPALCYTPHPCCSIITLPARLVDMALVILFLRVPCCLRSSDLPCRCPPVLRNRRSIRATIRCLSSSRPCRSPIRCLV